MGGYKDPAAWATAPWPILTTSPEPTAEQESSTTQAPQGYAQGGETGFRAELGGL